MDRGHRQTHPVRRLKHRLRRSVRVWVWECVADTGFSVIGRLYCLSLFISTSPCVLGCISLTSPSRQHHLVSRHPPVLLGLSFYSTFLYPLLPY